MDADSRERLPLPVLDVIFLKAGIENPDFHSILALGDILENVGKRVAELAVELVQYAGRKTVQARDIKLAWEMFSKGQDIDERRP